MPGTWNTAMADGTWGAVPGAQVRGGVCGCRDAHYQIIELVHIAVVSLVGNDVKEEPFLQAKGVRKH